MCRMGGWGAPKQTKHMRKIRVWKRGMFCVVKDTTRNLDKILHYLGFFDLLKQIKNILKVILININGHNESYRR